MKSILHIYGQGGWHDAALLLGDRDALIRLRDAVDEAIASGAGRCDVFTGDGEGYPVLVVRHEETELVLLPYTEEDAWDARKDAVDPWSLLRSTP